MSSGIEGDSLPRLLSVGEVSPAGDLCQRGRKGEAFANALQRKIQELTPSYGIKLLATIAAERDDLRLAGPGKEGQLNHRSEDWSGSRASPWRSREMPSGSESNSGNAQACTQAADDVRLGNQPCGVPRADYAATGNRQHRTTLAAKLATVMIADATAQDSQLPTVVSGQSGSVMFDTSGPFLCTAP